MQRAKLVEALSELTRLGLENPRFRYGHRLGPQDNKFPHKKCSNEKYWSPVNSTETRTSLHGDFCLRLVIQEDFAQPHNLLIVKSVGLPRNIYEECLPIDRYEVFDCTKEI
jgi:hypothetical protein